MVKIFGEFLHQFPPDHDSLELTFTPTSRPIQKRWRNNRLSAHFVADYFSTFLPADTLETDQEARIKQSKGAVTYVANELLENAMKFNYEAANTQIRFGIHFLEGKDVTAAIFATNSITLERAQKFEYFIQELLTEDPNELYIRQVESSAVDDNDEEASGLGLLTMLNDYQAKLGWKFELMSEQPKIILVTTMAQVKV